MKRLCTVIIAASLLIVGCGGPEAKYVGKYTGRIEMSEQMLNMMKAFAAMGGEEALASFEEEMKNSTFELELNSDSTYTTTDKGKTESGTWRLDEESGRIYLSVPEETKEAMDAANSNNPMAGMTGVGAGGMGGIGKMADITEIGFSISEDGKVLSMSMMEMLKEQGVDPEQGVMDMSGLEVKIIFTKQ